MPWDTANEQAKTETDKYRIEYTDARTGVQFEKIEKVHSAGI